MVTIKKWSLWARVVLLGLSIGGLPMGCTPSGPRALLDGERLIRQGQYAQAVKKLEVAVEKLPKYAQAWNHLGLAYHGAQQPDLAVRAYQHALALDRNLVAAHFNLGCLLLEQTHLPPAISELGTCTILQPNFADAWIKLGVAELRARQTTAAEQAFNRALVLKPRLPEILNNLGLAQLQRNRPREALTQFANALQAQPGFSPALLNQAVVYHQYYRNPQAALQKYRDYLALKPTPPQFQQVQETVRQLALAATPTPPLAALNPLPSLKATNAAAGGPAASPAKPVLAAIPTAPPLTSAPTNRLPPNPTSTPPAKPAPATNPVQAPPPPVNSAQTNELSSSRTATPAPKPAPPAVKPSPPPTPVPTAAIVAQVETPVWPPPRQETNLPSILPPSPPPTSTAARSTQKAAVTSIPAPEEKRTWLQHLNPRAWFGGTSKPLSPTPLTPSASSPKKNAAEPISSPSSTILPTVAVANLPASSIPASPAALPSFPRYSYQSPAQPEPGDRPEAEKYFQRALNDHRNGKLNSAIESYRRAMQLDPAYFEALYNLAASALEIGDLPQALSASEKALAINPAATAAHYNFALALQQAHYPLDAVAEFEKATAADPKNAPAHLALGNLYSQQLAQPASAIEHYRKVLELEPRHPQAEAIRFWLAAHPQP